MKIISAILTGILLIVSFSVHAWNEKIISIAGQNIEALKAHTTYHDATGARNIALIRLSGLEGNCTSGVFFDTLENKAAFSIALSAVISKNEIKITYDIDQRSPWGDTKYCALTGIQFES